MKKLRLISVKILLKFHINGERGKGHQSEKTVVDAHTNPTNNIPKTSFIILMLLIDVCVLVSGGVTQRLLQNPFVKAILF